MPKRNYVLVLSLLVVLTASTCILTVSAYNYGSNEYGVGVANITLGYPVHVIPFTNDPTATYVTVEWDQPGGIPWGPIAWSDTSTSPPTSSGGNFVFSVPDHTPTMSGQWYIRITFFNAAGQQLKYDAEVINLDPLTPVPELPLLGTAGGALICLFATFIYITKIKPRKLK